LDLCDKEAILQAARVAWWRTLALPDVVLRLQAARQVVPAFSTMPAPARLQADIVSAVC